MNSVTSCSHTTHSLFTGSAAEKGIEQHIFVPDTNVPQNITFTAQQITSTKVRAISDYSSYRWTCVGEEHDHNGGFRYKFRYTPRESQGLYGVYPFPAEEPKSMPWEGWESYEKLFHEQMFELGFEVNNWNKTLLIPDRESFTKRWAEFRKKRPDLPELSTITSDGILSHADYLKAWKENDLIFSLGNELVHDFTDHSLKTLYIILKDGWNFYKHSRDAAIKRIVPKMDKMEALRTGVGIEKYAHSAVELKLLQTHLPKLEALVSAIVDTLFPFRLTNLEPFFDDSLFVNPHWRIYFRDQIFWDEEFLKKLWATFNKSIYEQEDQENRVELEATIENYKIRNLDMDMDFIFSLQLSERRVLLYLLNKALPEIESNKNLENSLRSVLSCVNEVCPPYRDHFIKLTDTHCCKPSSNIEEVYKAVGQIWINLFDGFKKQDKKIKAH